MNPKSTVQQDSFCHLFMLNKPRTLLLTLSMQLSKEQVHCQFDKGEYCLGYQDIMTVDVQEAEPKELKKLQVNKEMCVYALTIQTYALNPKTKKRVKDKCVIYQQTVETLLVIQKQILKLHSEIYPANQRPPTDRLLRAQKLLVFVNPASGRGKAARISKASMPQLTESGLEVKVVMTQHADYVPKYLESQSSEQLSEYQGVVSVSGDGLPHEVINSLQSREGLQDIAIGQIEGGTANSLQFNLAHFQKEKNSREHQLFHIIKGVTRPLHLLDISFSQQASTVEQSERKKKEEKWNKSSETKYKLIEGASQQTQVEQTRLERVQSFLSITYGLLSDIDLESEKIRWMGPIRFTVWGFVRFFSLKAYSGSLYYSTTASLPDIAVSLDGHEEFKCVKGEFVHLGISKLPFISPDVQLSPGSNQQDGLFDIGYSLRTAGRMSVLKFLLGLDTKGSHTKQTTQVRALSFRFVPDQDAKQAFYSIDGEKYPPRAIQGSLNPRPFQTYASF